MNWLIIRDGVIILLVVGSIVGPNFGFVPFTHIDDATTGREIGRNLVPVFSYLAGLWLIYRKVKEKDFK